MTDGSEAPNQASAKVAASSWRCLGRSCCVPQHCRVRLFGRCASAQHGALATECAAPTKGPSRQKPEPSTRNRWPGHWRQRIARPREKKSLSELRPGIQQGRVFAQRFDSLAHDLGPQITA